MATWQFDFHLVPRSEVERRFGTVPLAISDQDYNQFEWWSGDDHGGRLLEALSSLLPKGRSWHSESDTWGTEDGDRFDVVRDGRRIAEVRGRLDVRNLSLSYLNRVIDIARENGLLIVTESRHVLRPSVKELLAAIHRSPSFSFVGDPAAFLDRLSGAD